MCLVETGTRALLAATIGGGITEQLTSDYPG
jgi:hypothetical protein